MKIKQWTIGALVCGLATAATPAFAQADAGWYVGASLGQSTYDIDQDELDDLVIDVFASEGAPLLTGSSDLEDGDTLVSVFAGYRFNRYLAVEAGYVNLGTATYESSGTVNPPGPVASTSAGLDLDFSSKGFTIAGIASAPIGDMFDVHARLGVLIADSTVDIATRIGSGSAGGDLSASSQETLYGVGAAVNFSAGWSVSLDWTRYADVGDEDETDETSIDALSLGLMYRFL